MEGGEGGSDWAEFEGGVVEAEAGAPGVEVVDFEGDYLAAFVKFGCGGGEGDEGAGEQDKTKHGFIKI